LRYIVLLRRGDKEAEMRDIARLLFGDDGGLQDLFDGAGDLFDGADGDGFGMADRARRAGEWCGSTPGGGSAADALRGAARPRGMRRQVIIREFRTR
jgi:hypothetical protein